jgi:DNA polymerase IV
MLRSFFIDFNSYFASVEQQLHPELRGRPIAVVPVLADTTSAIAASYEAKAFGVKTGTRIADAKKMCPDLTLVHARHGKYIEYHHRLVDVVESLIHVERVMSIDEMTCELTGRMTKRENAVDLAHRVKHAIASEVGECLRCSIGIAPNTFLAKTATDMQKPDGLVVIEQSDLPHILFQLELRDLVGIGKKIHERLYKHGIYTVEMLCNASKQKLREAWGGVEGERMYQRLRGEWVPHVETRKSSISHQHVLEPSLRTRDGSAGVLHRLLQKAAMRLRTYGMLTGNLFVKISYRDNSKWVSDTDITPTQDTIQLTNALTKALDARPDAASPAALPRSTRGRGRSSESSSTRSSGAFLEPMKVTVAFTKLYWAEATPEPLFGGVGPSRNKLNEGLDKLNTKYGKNTIYMGTSWNAKNSAPMRIAFHHIPDLETDDDDD